jgi:DNA (cytosine-5)-methyltransferase 1
MISIELFAGAGGMATGLAAAGFEPMLLAEKNPRCVETLYLNGHGNDAFIHHGDVMAIDYLPCRSAGVDLIAGGPSCQPFSFGGLHRGEKDTRNVTTEFIRAVAETMPKAFLMENVKGITRPSFSSFLSYLINWLKCPSTGMEGYVSDLEHRVMLAVRSIEDPEYDVSFAVLNAADYGIPQCRERFILVGIRRDIGKKFTFPEKTHSSLALDYSKYISMDYWRRHGVEKRDIRAADNRISTIVGKWRGGDPGARLLPWVTIRDAIGCTWPDDAKPAKTYPGHSGSDIDSPSKTIKAGVHGIPGGENCVVFPDGRCRYLSIPEMAIIQGFPDGYVFSGSESDAVKQVGNAAPPGLVRAVASRIMETIS